MVLGIVADSIIWQLEIRTLFIQSAVAFWEFIVRLGRKFKVIITSVFNALVDAAKATGRFLYKTGLSIYESIVKFLHTTWAYRVEIVRALATIVGPIFVIFGLIFPPFQPQLLLQELLLRGFLVLVGTGLVYAAWRQQINEFVNRSLRTIKNVLIYAKNAIFNGIKAIGQFFYNTGRSIYENTIALLHTMWAHRLGLLRALMTMIGTLFLLGGIIWYDPSLTPGDLVVVRLGFAFVGVVALTAAWYELIIHILKQTVITIGDIVNQFGHAVWNGLIGLKNAIINTGKATGRFLVETGRNIYQSIFALLNAAWARRVDIFRALMTVSGFLLLLSAFVWYDPGLTPVNLLLFRLGLAIAGVVALTAAWYNQIIHILKQTVTTIRDITIQIGYAIWNGLVGIKDSIVNAVKATGRFLVETGHKIYQSFVGYLQAAWARRMDILRALMTVVGSLFLLVSLVWFDPNLTPVDLLVVRSGLFLTGMIILVVTWRHQVYELFSQAAGVIWNTLKRIGRGTYQFFVNVWNSLIEVGNIIIHFIRSNFEEILRYSGTVIGIGLILIGIGSFLINELFNSILLITGGMIFVWGSWFHQINDLLIRGFHAFGQIMVQLIDTVVSYVTLAFRQLGILLREIGNSIIPLSLFVLCIPVIFYGVVLVISGIGDPTGQWTRDLILVIPIIGDMIFSISYFIQGEDTYNAYGQTLLGFFADPANSFLLIPAGLGMVFIGAFILMIVFLKRENLQVRNLRATQLEGVTDGKKEEVGK
jgi:hypothetical protein